MPMKPLPAFTPVGSLPRGQYYRHSGRFNPAGVAAGLIAGVAAAAVLGFAYAYADKYIPIVQLNGLVCLGVGALFGVVPAMVMRGLKVRNTSVAMAVAALVAVVGFYVSWATWEASLTHDGLANLPHLLTHPADLASYAVRINEVGTWSIGHVGSSSSSAKGSATSGVMLWVIWAIEGLVMLGTPLLVVVGMLGSAPFCDACDRWCDGPTTVLSTGLPADQAEVKRRLDAGDFAYPATLGPPAADASLTFARHGCDRCNGVNTLTVTSKKITADRKGKNAQTAAKTLVNKLMVTPDDLARLKGPAPAAAPTA